MKEIILSLLVLITLSSHADEQMMNMPGMGQMPEEHSGHQDTPAPSSAPKTQTNSETPKTEAPSVRRSPPQLTPDPEVPPAPRMTSRRSAVPEGVGQTTQKCDEPCLGCAPRDRCQNTMGSDTNRDTNKTNQTDSNTDGQSTRVSPQ